MKKWKELNSKGFTLIELLMVILVIAILATVGITQFTNFAKDAKDSALKANLQLLRRGIANMNGMMRVRCGWTQVTFPDIAVVKLNDITNAGAGPPCTAAQVPQDADTYFVQGGIPVNPWDLNTANTNTIEQCTLIGCTDRTKECIAGAGARTTGSTGWCYDSATGQVWANTANNDGLNLASGTEYTF